MADMSEHKLAGERESKKSRRIKWGDSEIELVKKSNNGHVVLEDNINCRKK